jgi:hypothetical protein
MTDACAFEPMFKRTALKSDARTCYHQSCLMHLTGPIAQPGSELPAHNRLVPGSNPGGPISFVPAAPSPAGFIMFHHHEQKLCATRITLAERRIA